MMMKKALLKQFVFGLTLMIGATVGLFAQSTSGRIQGTVLDPSGALIPAAQITISNGDGFSRNLSSTSEGSFDTSGLAPGDYSISVDATGFTPALEGGVHVTSGEVAEENIKLGISVNQEIDVTADDNSL